MYHYFYYCFWNKKQELYIKKYIRNVKHLRQQVIKKNYFYSSRRSTSWIKQREEHTRFNEVLAWSNIECQRKAYRLVRRTVKLAKIFEMSITTDVARCWISMLGHDPFFRALVFTKYFENFNRYEYLWKKRTRTRAEYLTTLGFGIADAAHFAYSEAFHAELITCDDKFA